MNNIFEDGGKLVFEEMDLTIYTPAIPVDAITFGDDVDEPGLRIELSVLLEVIAALREAKEKHLSIMFTNDDETRALLVKDANDVNLKITANGIKIEEI